jgi:hypothetical protein
MYDRVKRGRFVLLRAQGKSIRAIAEELGISTSTVWQWNGEHAHEIAHLSQSGIGMTLSDLGVDKTERLKISAGLFNLLRSNIEQDIATGKIPDSEKMQYLLKVYQLICREDSSSVSPERFSKRPQYGMFLKPEPQPGIDELIGLDRQDY